MYPLTVIATTDERFDAFAPYVASVNDDGTVAIQATLRRGGTGVFTANGRGGRGSRDAFARRGGDESP